nr:immunoglobulin heavy chain junction region [Macaca mulatta]MPN74856.1 immunoglobulin heavy chain junction region [Macaca mulatta]MPN75154.1 immunoglobulin heavy chain junction region [Macaca mulatta]MPN76378.1 immunoglobulin heavy chain junction region [Macaca mulatta]MPN76817.1 immunoglobulin heavy chain junction region [Macaca mulatta]
CARTVANYFFDSW